MFSSVWKRCVLFLDEEILVLSEDRWTLPCLQIANISCIYMLLKIISILRHYYIYVFDNKFHLIKKFMFKLLFWVFE